MKKLTIGFSLLLLNFFCIKDCLAQASLASENEATITGVRNPKNGELKTYLLRRDSRNKDQWYYLPSRLRLVDKVVNGRVIPKIYHVKYQSTDKQTGDLKQAGLLMAVFTYKAYDEEEAEMLRKLTSQNPGTTPRLSPLPFKTAKYQVFQLTEGLLDPKYEYKLMDGSISAGEVAIVVPTTDLGISVLSKSGLPVLYNFSYYGYNPPCGGRIKGSWDNIYKFSEKTKKSGVAFKAWIFKIGTTKTNSEVKESFKTNLNVQIEEFECEQIANATEANRNTSESILLSKFLDNVINGVFTKSEVGQLGEITRLQAFLDTAKTADKAVLDKIASAIAQAETGLYASFRNRSITQTKTGNIDIKVDKYTLVERSTSLSGILSLKDYPNLTEEDMKNMVVEVNMDNDFPSGAIVLPEFFDEKWGIQSVGVTVKRTGIDIIDNTEKSWNRILNWSTTRRQWRTNNSNELEKPINFPLIGLKDVKFAAGATIDSKKHWNTFVIPMTNLESVTGEYIYDIRQLLSIIDIDPISLSFHRITENPSDLEYAKVKFNVGNTGAWKEVDVTPQSINGVYYKELQSLIFPKQDDREINYEITYKVRNSQQLIKVSGTLPINTEGQTLYLSDTDWK